jgi:rubrerythrin
MSRLEILVDHAQKINEGEFFQVQADEAGHLSRGQRAAWGSFLLSIATTESIEESLIEPLKKTFSHHALLTKCIDFHSRDERRHFQLLTEYVKKSFKMTKTYRSQSDLVVYDTILPKVTKALSHRPACLIGILHFYEMFSLDFYKELKVRATDNGLKNLVTLIQTLEKDELRHLACLELLMENLEKRSRLGITFDKLSLRAVLELLMADINTREWALHNRHVRKNVLSIGLKPADMAGNARKATKKATELVGGKSPS